MCPFSVATLLFCNFSKVNLQFISQLWIILWSADLGNHSLQFSNCNETVMVLGKFSAWHAKHIPFKNFIYLPFCVIFCTLLLMTWVNLLKSFPAIISALLVSDLCFIILCSLLYFQTKSDRDMMLLKNINLLPAAVGGAPEWYEEKVLSLYCPKLIVMFYVVTNNQFHMDSSICWRKRNLPFIKVIWWWKINGQFH